MSRIIVITNPAEQEDAALRYLDSWVHKMIKLAKQQSDTLIFELQKDRANQKELTQIISDNKPQLILFNGHGSDNCIMGYKGNILIKCDENEHLVKDKIIHALSCSSGKELGIQCIKIGTLAYIGYREEFKFVHSNKQSREDILNDDMANFILEPAYEAVVALIQGDTAKNAYNRSQEIYKENLAVLITSNRTELNTIVASQLFHDLKYQICLGNGEASF